MIPLKDDTPSTLTPYATISLIGACSAVFIWQRSLGPAAARGEAVCTLARPR